MHRGCARTVPRYNSNPCFLEVIHTLLVCVQSIRKLPVIGLNVRDPLYQLPYDSYYLLRRQVGDIQFCKRYGMGKQFFYEPFVYAMDLISISAQHSLGKTL
jgi:hypothetical protein